MEWSAEHVVTVVLRSRYYVRSTLLCGDYRYARRYGPYGTTVLGTCYSERCAEYIDVTQARKEESCLPVVLVVPAVLVAWCRTVVRQPGMGAWMHPGDWRPAPSELHSALAGKLRFVQSTFHLTADVRMQYWAVYSDQ